jgi:hypothetical protein
LEATVSSLPLVRTEYVNTSTGTVRSGATAHGESLTDVESYLVPHARMTSSTLHSWGVGDGLTVTAGAGQTALQVSTGVALDSAGNLIALAAGGSAIVDPDVDPTQVVNIPTVPVADDGIALATAGQTGDAYLTVTWREVLDPSSAGNAPTLIHAPWLRLVPLSAVTGAGDQVVLARVRLDAQGAVVALTAENRRSAGLPAGRLELVRSRATPGTPASVGPVPAGEIGAGDDGGLTIAVRPDGGAPVPVVTADPSGAAVALQPGGGQVGIGLHGAAPQRVLHVEGTEVHSGGPGGGYSFADRTVGAFDSSGGAGARWIWYAQDATARLWSGADQIVVATKGTGPNPGAGARLGIGTPAPTHAVHVAANSGIRQNSLYVGGGAGWSSLSYNAFHNETNQSWVFPDPARPAVTLEMDDSSNVPRFQVFSTTTSAPQSFQFRFGIDGNTGVVTVPGTLAAGVLSASSTGSNTAVNASAANGHAICASCTSTTAALIAVNNTGGGAGPALATIGTSSLVGAVSVTGDMSVSGTLRAGAKQFVIDHPLDPENQVLAHASVESDERAVVYSGNVTCGPDGTATVRLPDWLEALATDFRYQLTCIGGHADVYIAETVRDNAFGIAGGSDGLQVSWQLTGVRQDAWARTHDLVVEDEKPPAERGFYEHPEAYGKRLDASVQWPRHEELIKRNPALARRTVRHAAERETRRVEAQLRRRQAVTPGRRNPADEDTP